MPSTPAESLGGLVLKGRWTVKNIVVQPRYSTGGHFSVGYIVKDSDGTEAFMKVLDFSNALKQSDVLKAINDMTTAYIFERDLCIKCNTKRLKRVVTAIDHGYFCTSRQKGGFQKFCLLRLPKIGCNSQN
jgi:hypothetical protein